MDELIDRARRGEATEAELGELTAWRSESAENERRYRATMRLLEATKFPVEEMVSHIFPLDEIERAIRAVGGEFPELYPTKALIRP